MIWNKHLIWRLPLRLCASAVKELLRNGLQFRLQTFATIIFDSQNRKEKTMKVFQLLMTAVLITASMAGARAGDAPVAGAATRLGVREVTVFKDGHAFVRSAGRLPTGPAGHVTLDRLPQPVFGLFWPYAAEKDVRLAGASAGVRPVRKTQPALSVRDLVRVNVGARVLVTEHADPKSAYEAVIVGPVGPESTRPPAVAPSSEDAPAGELPKQAEMVLLRTDSGVKALPLDQIRSLTFPDAYRDTMSAEESRPLLTLRLDWGGRAPRPEAEVGLVYLQKGLRWIPGYKLDIDGRGNARVIFQATLINELADLDDATVNLVVGVPSFLFKDTLDPMAMAAETPRLSQYFSSGDGANMLSNTMVVSQQAFSGNLNRYGPAPGAESGSGVPSQMEGADEGDLHLFTLPHVTLRNGERMAVTISEFTVRYEDVYTLDVPLVPPLELQRNLNTDRQLELARLMAEPRVKHKLNVVNGTGDPLTTAPAVVLRDGRLVAQGMMTYTPPGAACLLELTTAVNIRVQKQEEETKRTPDALAWHGGRFDRVDLAGSIGLANFGGEAVDVVVTRRVLGAMDSAGAAGTIQRLNALEESAPARWPGAPGFPAWWAWLDWPFWWRHVNGLGQAQWKVRLEPGQPVHLDYAWHYFWD
jgi:hypothetical protein